MFCKLNLRKLSIYYLSFMVLHKNVFVLVLNNQNKKTDYFSAVKLFQIWSDTIIYIELPITIDNVFQVTSNKKILWIIEKNV